MITSFHPVAEVGDDASSLVRGDDQVAEVGGFSKESQMQLFHTESGDEEQLFVDVHHVFQAVSLAVMEEDVPSVDLLTDVPQTGNGEDFAGTSLEAVGGTGVVDETTTQIGPAGVGIAIVVPVEQSSRVGAEEGTNELSHLVGRRIALVVYVVENEHVNRVGVVHGPRKVEGRPTAEVGGEGQARRHRPRRHIGIDEGVEDVVFVGAVQIGAAMAHGTFAERTRFQHALADFFQRGLRLGQSPRNALLKKIVQRIVAELLLLKLGQLFLLLERQGVVVGAEMRIGCADRLPQEVLTVPTIQHQLVLERDVEDAGRFSVQQDELTLSIGENLRSRRHGDDRDVVGYTDRDRDGTV